MPVISVVIPAYNAEKTIRNTIESVLNQTFSDFELIVINDGSTDATLEKVQAIQDPRVRLLSQSNSGAQRSRNKGLAEATGEYIAFLDADDLWTVDKLEAQLSALKANPDAAVAYSWTDFVDSDGQFLRHARQTTLNGDVWSDLIIFNFLESGSNPLVYRHALVDVGGFDESLPVAQDWDLYLRLAAKYFFVAVPKSQILYRVSTHSISTNVQRMETTCLEIIENSFSEAPEPLQTLKRKSLAHLYRYLTFQTIDRLSERKKSLLAARYLWLALYYDHTLRKDGRLLFITAIKILLSALFPPKYTEALLKKLKSN